jgi:hypothetical protein
MPGVITTMSRSNEVIAALKKLADVHVMVGIPQSKSGRQGTGPANNALLGYVHENGSPARNIPARPFLRPGIMNARQTITKYLEGAARAAIDGQPQQMMMQLEAAGMAGATGAQQKITDGPFAPLAPRTIAARRAKLRGTTALTAAQRAGGFVDIRPLIDTGQLRRSITYVIRQRGIDVSTGP